MLRLIAIQAMYRAEFLVRSQSVSEYAISRDDIEYCLLATEYNCNGYQPENCDELLDKANCIISIFVNMHVLFDDIIRKSLETSDWDRDRIDPVILSLFRCYASETVYQKKELLSSNESNEVDNYDINQEYLTVARFFSDDMKENKFILAVIKCMQKLLNDDNTMANSCISV